MPKYFAGMMRHKVDFEDRVKSKDSSLAGGYSFTWALKIDGCRGFLRAASTSETIKAGRMETNVSHVFVTRHRTDIEPTYRVVYEDRTFQIIGRPINVEEKSRWMEIQLVEGTE